MHLGLSEECYRTCTPVVPGFVVEESEYRRGAVSEELNLLVVRLILVVIIGVLLGAQYQMVVRASCRYRAALLGCVLGVGAVAIVR